MQKNGESKCKRCKSLLLCLLVETQSKEKDAKKTLKSENANKFNIVKSIQHVFENIVKEVVNWSTRLSFGLHMERYLGLQSTTDEKRMRRLKREK